MMSINCIVNRFFFFSENRFVDIGYWPQVIEVYLGTHNPELFKFQLFLPIELKNNEELFSYKLFLTYS